MLDELSGFITTAGKSGLLNSRITPEQVGHDFYLTRNCHGAGFWDRGNGKMGDELTELAHPYGGFELYLGDDGLLYN